MCSLFSIISIWHFGCRMTAQWDIPLDVTGDEVILQRPPYIQSSPRDNSTGLRIEGGEDAIELTTMRNLPCLST